MVTTCLDYIKMFYVTKVKRFKLDEVAPATLLFEGSKEVPYLLFFTVFIVFYSFRLNVYSK